MQRDMKTDNERNPTIAFSRCFDNIL